MIGLRYIPFCFGMLLSASVTAQQPTFQHWSSHRTGASFIGLNASGVAASSDFGNAFVKDFLSADHIDSAAIASGLKHLDPFANRIGGDYDVALMAKLNVAHSAHSILFRLADVAHLHGSVPLASAQLLLIGNKPFLGDTVVASEMEASLWRYQQVGMGWQYEPSPGTSYFVMASYINGEQYLDAKVDRLWLYTSTLGDTLSAGLNGGYAQSDTGSVGFAKPNGYGAALDFGFARDFKSEVGGWRLKAAVYNLGMVQWNPKTVHFAADTNLEWTGVKINDVTKVDEQFSGGTLEDSLGQSLTKLYHKGYTNEVIPGWAHAELMRYRNQGAEFGGGMAIRWKAGYKPYGYLVGGYRFNDHIAMHGTAGYGGYAALQIGVQASFEYEHLALAARITNLETLVVPTQYAGGGASLSLRYML
ncbi:MAG: DUF5723 family protein [Flavobacteriales bacterium]